MAIICRKCQKENRDEALICQHCGNPLSEPAPENNGGFPEADHDQTGPGLLPDLPLVTRDLPDHDLGAGAIPSAGAFSDEAERLKSVEQRKEAEESKVEGSDLEEAPIQPLEEYPALETTPQIEAGLILANRYRVISWQEKNQDIVFLAEDMQKCWSCGAEIELQEAWCGLCGSEISHFPQVNILPGEATPPGTSFEWRGKVYHAEELPGQPVPQTPQHVKLIAGYTSHNGMVRDVDEDSLLVIQLTAICEMLPDPGAAFFAVADGIGGADAGEVASRIAVRALAKYLLLHIFQSLAEDETPLPERVVDYLKDAVEAANRRILAFRQREHLDMGCTLTCALVIGQQVWVANVGDSRTYLIHNGILNQISKDHSVVAGLAAAGIITPDEIYSHPQRNIILRSLGDKAELTVDIFTATVEAGDRLLLCCDGLWEMVRPPEILATLEKYPEPQQASDELVRLANLAGGEDNISVIVVQVLKTDLPHSKGD